MLKIRLIAKVCLLSLLSFSIFNLGGCGFQLRGDLCIPKAFQILSISPDQPFDAFQRVLRHILRANQVQLIECSECLASRETQTLDKSCPGNILCVINQNFSERNIAFGSDVQVNRVLLQFKVEYQITDRKGNVILDCNTLQVERELTINPSAVLGTDHDRVRVQNELYNDAALQLIRQLSYTTCW